MKTRQEEYARMAQGKEFMPASHKPDITGMGGKASPPRPSSLEVQQGSFVPPPDGTYMNNLMQGQEYPTGYNVTGNGPITQMGEQYECYTDQPRTTEYQQQLYLKNGHIPTEYLQQAGTNHYDTSEDTYRKRTGQQVANIASPRPSQPPPAPPSGGMSHSTGVMGSQAGNSSRESLPPPPPPPPPHEHVIGLSHTESRYSPHGSPQHRASEIQQSVGHHMTAHPTQHVGTVMINKTPESIDLPPPPPPPLLQSDRSSATPDTPRSLTSMPPPPPSPPPPPGGDQSSALTPPPPLSSVGGVTNGTTSSSNTSANATPTRITKAALPKIVDERSDLLAAIRTGESKWFLLL